VTVDFIKDVIMTDPATPSLLTKGNAWIARIETNAFGVIYGSVTVMALLLATGHGNAGPVETAVILFGSIFAIVLAETFAKISADAVQIRQPFGWAELRQGWVHSKPTLIAANIPTLLVAAAASGIYSLETGVILAQISATGLLEIYGYSIGWVIYGRTVPGVLHAAFTSGIGLALALVKFLVH
jgi:hypothetical protein